LFTLAVRLSVILCVALTAKHGASGLNRPENACAYSNRAEATLLLLRLEESRSYVLATAIYSGILGMPTSA